MSDDLIGPAVNAVLVPRRRSGSRRWSGRHALRLVADPGDPAVVGTVEEYLADL